MRIYTTYESNIFPIFLQDGIYSLDEEWITTQLKKKEKENTIL